MNEFLSTPPEIKLVNAFDSPLNNAVAAAKTCYSSRGVVYGNDVVAPDNGGADSRETRIRKRDNLARSLYKAGHHTVFQHAHFQFSISNVSRFFVWSFLHSHPFYNSEQVSQRYVEVRNNSYAVPPMPEPAYQIYDEIIQLQFNAYHRLIDALEPCVRNEYYSIFKGRRPQNDSSADSKAIKKKCMEIARYVLPISTFTHLYHTISLITLMRYHRLMNIFDTTMEQRLVVGKMIEAVLEFAPELELLFEESIPLEFTPEFRFMEQLNNHRDPEFIKEFDASLDGRTSKLISRAGDNEGLLAGAVREIFGISEKRMDDRNAIESVLNPASNTWLGEAMNVTHYTKICRAMEHPVYTFRKKLSHTADSQNQRHRTTPASRPCLTASIADEPDYITPAVIKEHDPARKLYEQIMETTWDGINRLKLAGAGNEAAAYLLPNAVPIRFTETSSLINLAHKHAMRFCFNAQEEIWQAAVDEATQIRQVNPRIGEFLLPPCSRRYLAERKPFCPEGPRYCGRKVWLMDISEFMRII